ncbi:MAG: hypothetical protein ACYSWU_05475 [Planctomycetota bacterium]|jgi:hypothetical protein
MSRRRSRSAARKTDATPQHPARPATEHSADPQRNGPGPNKWFLAVTILMQSAWIGFLVVMALSGQ